MLVAPMDSANSRLPDHTPGIGFQVLHYWKHISAPNDPPMVHLMGPFTSLDHAQDATRCEYLRLLATHVNLGYHGRTFSQVDLNLHGLITTYVDASVDTGQVTRCELPLNEFCIRTVDVWDQSWSAEVHRSSLDSLFRVPDGHGRGRPVVSLPKSPAYDFLLESAPPHVRHQEELPPTWARSRIPLFVRRDEGPFRGPDDPCYAERMQFSPS